MADFIQKYAVEFDIHTKVVKLVDEVELFADIEFAFRNVHSFPKKYIVQYEDSDLGMFVDLENVEDLRNRKSNILRVHPCKESNLNQSYADEVQESRSDDESEVSICNEKSKRVKSQSTPQSEDSSGKWPYPFIIKDHMIRKSVLDKLKKNESFFSEAERTSILAGLYDECANLKLRYPSSAQYRDMVQGLLRRFPCIVVECLSFEDAATLWHERLKSYFKRARGRIKEEEDPEVDSNRRKYGKRKNEDNGESPLPRKKTILRWGVANFLPDIEEGEDDETFLAYQSEMKQQLKKIRERRDTEKIDALMKKTFAHRRKLIVKDMARLKDVVNQYPLICDKDQILKEFHRITGWELEERIKFSLKKYANYIVSNKSAAEKEILDSLRLSCSSASCNDNRQYFMMCICLLSIPFHLRENPLGFFETDGETRQPRIYSPQINKEGDISKIFDEDIEFFLKVEDITIAETSDFLQAIILFVASSYVFNTEYAKGSEATMIFIQKFFLNISDQTKTPDKVSKFVGVVKKGVMGL